MRIAIALAGLLLAAGPVAGGAVLAQEVPHPTCSRVVAKSWFQYMATCTFKGKVLLC